MSNPLEDKSIVEDDFELVLPIPGKTTDSIYCPSCSAKMKFTMRLDGLNHSFFCGKCSERISDYWDGYQKDQLSIIRCNECQEPTFAECRYCINCGKISNLKAADSYSSSIKRGRKLGKNMPLRARQAMYFLFGLTFLFSIISALEEFVDLNVYLFYSSLAIGLFSAIAGLGVLIFFSNTKDEPYEVKRKKFSFLLICVFGVSALLGGFFWLIGFLLDRFFGSCCWSA